jgi:hypothetical protein
MSRRRTAPAQEPVQIHPIRELFGPPTPAAVAARRVSLRAHPQGVRVWTYRGKLLHGWTTLLAAGLEGIKPEFVRVLGTEDDAAVKALALRFARAHYSAEQRAAHLLLLADHCPAVRAEVDRITAEASGRERAGKPLGSDEPRGRSADQIAAMVQVSPATLKRAARLKRLSEEHGLPDFADFVAGKQACFARAIRGPVREDIIRAAEALPPARPDQVRLYQSDFRRLPRVAGLRRGEPACVWADPDFYLTSLWKYRDAAQIAARLLCQRGWLGAVCGNVRKGLVYGHLGGSGLHEWHECTLPFVTRSAYGEERAAYCLHKGVKERKRNLLIYTRTEGYEFPAVIDDLRPPVPPEKQWHDWQHPLAWALYYLRRLCRPGDLVVDLFAGGGTVAVACMRLGLRYVGCDTDPRALRAARARVREEYHRPGNPLEDILHEEEWERRQAGKRRKA